MVVLAGRKVLPQLHPVASRVSLESPCFPGQFDWSVLGVLENII